MIGAGPGVKIFPGSRPSTDFVSDFRATFGLRLSYLLAYLCYFAAWLSSSRRTHIGFPQYSSAIPANEKKNCCCMLQYACANSSSALERPTIELRVSVQKDGDSSRKRIEEIVPAGGLSTML